MKYQLDNKMEPNSNMKGKSGVETNETFKEYLKLLNRLYDITWFGSVYA
jgi:hypothetical protein